MGEIKHLPEAVHSCVRSGIILFDITRVVEELVFNSLDAGATKISVAVGAGTCYVKVVDNGCGITRDGLVLLGERYATSKFDQLADTDAVTRSFGFRGEALSSISDVSLLEVMTKAHGRPHGYRKVIKGCKCLYLGIDNGRQDVGTTVIARDLFYNQPVRRKHILSSMKKVLQAVKKSVHRIALIHPRVFFKVVDIDSDDELFSTAPSSSTLSQLMSGFGIEVCSSLHEINASDGVVKLSGYISSPCDTASVKAFQYVYINSRYISKGPIHKLLNQLTVKFNSLDLQKADIGSQNAKRSRSQTSIAYILNLSCPRSWYDVTFEPSMTSVEFKDWFSIVSFIENAITSFWSEKFSYGDPLGHGTNVLEEDNMWREGDNSSAPEEVKYEITKRRYRICNHQDPFGLPSPQPDMQTEEIDYISCQEDGRFSCRNALDFKEQCAGFACGYQTDYSFYSCDGSLTPSNVTINRESDRHLCKDHFLGNKFLAEENYNEHADNILGSSFEDNMDASLSSVYMESALSRDCFEIGSDEEKVSKDLKKPFMRSCSSRRRLPVDAESLVSSEGFDFQNYGLRTKRKRLRPNARFHVEEVDDIDQIFNFRQKTLRQDEIASVWSSPKPITKCNRLTSLDILSRDSVVTSAIGECLATESDVTLDSVVHIGQFGSTRQSFDSEWSSVISDPLFGTKSHDVEQFVDENPLERGIKYDVSDRFDNLANREIKDHIFQFDDTVRNSSSQENCFLSSWTNMCSDFKSSAHSEEDGYGFLQKHNIDDVLFPKYSDICDEKEWVCLDSCGKNNGNCCAVTSYHASSSIYSNKDAKQMDQTIYREKDYVCERRPRRSHSAPPFYRGKKKFFTLSNHLTLEAGKPKILAIADSPTAQETSELKHSQRSSGLGLLLSESNSVEDLLVYNRLDKKKAPEMGDVQKLEMQKNSEDLHIFSSDLVEDIQDPLNSELKWRKNYAKTANGDKLHDLHNEGTILDVSSGILHLAGDSLVPEFMTKNCLEDAKVLQQVDKKFIPFVGSGVLAIIDQHAADERIRLEELRHKVLSGEKKTITYLDTEQKLVLPEIAYQLLHTYAEQIQNWGWLCNIHASDSRSFKKNLNLLCKHPAVVTLVAVPCILGVNLTDADLLEFLQQLADTDGSSAIPPSVHRVLNFKACRGAIMFGDTLLPSECSLIVEELKQTSLCFQCAHGRPTTVPLINLEALRKQIAKLESLNGGSNEFWHGLRRHEISLERAAHRLSSS